MDRNRLFLGVARCKRRSLSARRAWIEIQSLCSVRHIRCVALRKESVDRNTSIDNLTQGVFESLSARRAWIEIVDDALEREVLQGRSPQGERG